MVIMTIFILLHSTLRPNFTLNLVHRLAFGTPKFYIVPNGKTDCRFVNLSYKYNLNLGIPNVNLCTNFGVKASLRLHF